MPDQQRLMRLGRLREIEAELPQHDARFRNAVEALYRHLTLYRTPGEVDMDAVEAAVADMREHRDGHNKAAEEANRLREQLGVS